MPGRYALKLCPDLLSRLASQVQTVAVTGTNGKTTSARMIEEAIALRELAGKQGVYALLQERFPGSSVAIPYRRRMAEISIEEMNLSVRSSNGLRRAGAHTFGGLWALQEEEKGLRSVRNLGVKSETEIRRSFLAACYTQLSPAEKARFWQQILQSREMKQD